MAEQTSFRTLADVGYDATSHAVQDMVGAMIDVTYVEFSPSEDYEEGALFHGHLLIAPPGFNAGDDVKIRATAKRVLEALHAAAGSDDMGRFVVSPPMRVTVQKQGRVVYLQ